MYPKGFGFTRADYPPDRLLHPWAKEYTLDDARAYDSLKVFSVSFNKRPCNVLRVAGFLLGAVEFGFLCLQTLKYLACFGLTNGPSLELKTLSPHALKP